MGVPLPSHPSLSEVFTALEQAVTSFQSTHPDNDDFARTSTYKRFFPLLRSATPPVWPAVQQVLHAQFGETSASCRAGVEAGEMGVGLVVDVLARTEVGEDFSAAMAAKLWLVQLESAVTKAELDLLRRQSATPAAAASPASTAPAPAAQLPTPSETAQANPFAVPAPTPTPPATSTRPPFGSYSNPSGWTATPTTWTASSARERAKSPVFAQQDQHMDDPWKSDDFGGPSASGGNDPLDENGRSRSRSQAPPREDTPPKVVKEKTPAPRASASASTSRRETPVRSTRAQSPKYTLTIGSDSSELGEATESEEDEDEEEDDEDDDEVDDDLSYHSGSDGGLDGASSLTKAKTPTEQGGAGPSSGAATPAVAAAAAPAKRPAPVATPAPAPAAQRPRLAAPAANHQAGAALQASAQATFLATVFRPLALPDLSPPAALTTHLTLNRIFTRPQIGGPQREIVSKGWTKQHPQYRSSANFLALDPTLNFCGREKDDYGALGQPIAILARKDKCNEILGVLKKMPERGKTRAGSQIFVRRASAQWAYCGWYELAYDGSMDDTALPLPSGPGEFNRLHPDIQAALKKRGTGQVGPKTQRTIRDWGFTGLFKEDKIDLDRIKAELASGRGDRMMRFIVLRCTRFDQEAFNVWNAARE
ncbi:hypothetical protein JCM10049v2_006049 [Rhodotorula toruloides]